MLGREDALKICETVLAHAKAAGAEDATVSLQSTLESHARFADNRITTSGRSDDLDITATVWVGKRRGAITGNDPVIKLYSGATAGTKTTELAWKYRKSSADTPAASADVFGARTSVAAGGTGLSPLARLHRRED